MKKWKYLLKVVMAVGVIAMTAVQICTAAEGTAQAAVSEVTPDRGTDGCRQRNSSVQQGRR